MEPIVEEVEELNRNVFSNRSGEATVEDMWYLWHYKLGHLEEDYLKKLTLNLVGVELEVPERSSFENCVVCQEIPPISVEEVINERQSDWPGKLLILHVSQVFPKEYSEEKPFVMIIVDDFSNFCRVNFCKDEFGMMEFLENFVQESNVQLFTTEVEVLQVEDSTIEFYAMLLQWVEQRGIEITTTNTQTRRTNPKASLLLNTVLRKAEAMLFDYPYNDSLWDECIQAAANLFNTTTIINETTPHEQWFGWPLSLNKIRCFGTPIYKRNPDNLSLTHYLYVGPEFGHHRVWDPSLRRTQYLSDLESESESDDENEFENDDELPRTVNVVEAHVEPLGENEFRNDDDVVEAHPEPLCQNEILQNINNEHRELFRQGVLSRLRHPSEEDP